MDNATTFLFYKNWDSLNYENIKKSLKLFDFLFFARE